ncbi:MAG: hypothetical protein V3S70_00795 [Gammaproteobacteria bacterium]
MDFKSFITWLAVGALVLAAVIAYLKVNKIWARKHHKEVAASVSVAAAFLSLFTILPFMIKFVVVDQDYAAAGRAAISLVVFMVMVTIGIGFWVRRDERKSIWQLVKQSLLTESGELAYLIHSFAKPKEAATIVRILQLVSAVDKNLDEREIRVIESVARPWGIHVTEIMNADLESLGADIETVRKAFLEYLSHNPPKNQASKVFDLVRFLIQADKKVTHEEQLILDEISHVVKGYLDKDYKTAVTYEVLVVPQHAEERNEIVEMIGSTELKERAGGEAYVAGTYFSELFAHEMCKRYRDMHHFSTVEARIE